MAGDPKFSASQDLPDVPYAEWARLLGLAGRRIDAPDQVEAAVAEAWRAERPFVLDTYVDADVPPLPPHIRPEQALSITEAMLRGDPDTRGIVRQTFRDLGEDFLPHPQGDGSVHLPGTRTR